MQEFVEKYYTERVRRYRLVCDPAFGRASCGAAVAVNWSESGFSTLEPDDAVPAQTRLGDERRSAAHTYHICAREQ
jgi:hypothetical protein